MRKLIVLVVPAVLALSGCARWIVFGHTFGGDDPASAVQPVSPAPNAVSTMVPPPAAPPTAGLQAGAAAPTPVAAPISTTAAESVPPVAGPSMTTPSTIPPSTTPQTNTPKTNMPPVAITPMAAPPGAGGASALAQTSASHTAAGPVTSPAAALVPASANAQPAGLSEGYGVSALAVSFTPEAKAKISADPRFNADSLRSTIESELRARKLMGEANLTMPARTVHILIDDFSTHASSNAVLFGYVVSAGTLAANIEVRDTDGHPLQGFHIQANSRLMVKPVAGDASNALSSLYSRFADMTVDNLAGTPGKSDVHPINQMP